MIIQVSTLEHRRVTPVGPSSLIDVLTVYAEQAGAPVVERGRARSLVEALQQVPNQRDPRVWSTCWPVSSRWR
jgi:hypothetical protein